MEYFRFEPPTGKRDGVLQVGIYISCKGSMLIPGLPDDVALHCMIRLPRLVQVKLRCVSKAWNDLLSSNEFYSLREGHKFWDDWLLLIVCDNSRIIERSSQLLAFDLKSRTCCGIHAPLKVEKQLELLGLRCASIGPVYFVLGGCTTNGIDCYSYRTMSIFNAGNNTWTQGASMNVARSYFACGYINGVLYVAGGYCFEQSGEAYDIKSNKWRPIAPMPFGLSDIKSDVVYKGKLYIKGQVGYKMKVLVYDPECDAWEHSKKMEQNIMDGEFVATDDHLYVISKTGYIGKYVETVDEWQQVGSISLSFVPFMNSPSENVILLGKDAFSFNHLEEDSADLKSSMQVHRALLKAFWQWQGAVLQV